MLTKMSVPFRTVIVPSLSKILAAEIAHAIPADTGELVASGGFDEGGAATGADAFDGVGAGSFDRLAE